MIYTKAMIQEEIFRFLKTAQLSTKTAGGYDYSLRVFFNWVYDNNKNPPDITDEDILDFLDSHPDWSSSTRHSSVAAIRKFYGWKFGKNHPVMSVIVRLGDPGPQRTLDKDEVASLFAEIDTKTEWGIRDYAILALMVDTGMRSGEICNLETKNIYLNKLTLNVLTKGDKWQRKVFTEKTRKAIDNWLDVRRGIAKSWVRTLFVSIGGKKRGEPMTVSGMLQIVHKRVEDAGLDPASPHAMRRTFATLSIESGAPTRLVQLAGGWKTLEMVERYTQALTADSMRKYSPMDHVKTENADLP